MIQFNMSQDKTKHINTPNLLHGFNILVSNVNQTKR